MTYDQAVKLYMSKQKRARVWVARLMRWNGKLSTRQNMRNLKIGAVQIYRMKQIFGLKCANGRDPIVRINRKRVKAMRSIGLTLQEIGRLYGVSRQRIEQISKIGRGYAQ